MVACCGCLLVVRVLLDYYDLSAAALGLFAVVWACCFLVFKVGEFCLFVFGLDVFLFVGGVLLFVSCLFRLFWVCVWIVMLLNSVVGIHSLRFYWCLCDAFVLCLPVFSAGTAFAWLVCECI